MTNKRMGLFTIAIRLVYSFFLVTGIKASKNCGDLDLSKNQGAAGRYLSKREIERANWTFRLLGSDGYKNITAEMRCYYMPANYVGRFDFKSINAALSMEDSEMEGIEKIALLLMIKVHRVLDKPLSSRLSKEDRLIYQKLKLKYERCGLVSEGRIEFRNKPYPFYTENGNIIICGRIM